MTEIAALFCAWPVLVAQTNRAKCLILRWARKIGLPIWWLRDFVSAKDGGNGR